MRCQWTLVGSCIALFTFGLVGRAGAAHLVKVDEQVLQQSPAQADQLPAQGAPCNSTGIFFGKGSGFRSQTLFADVGSRVSLAGTGCESGDVSSADASSASGMIAADPGDAAGPIVLCYTARYKLSAESTSGFTATAILGGFSIPVTGAATITQSPGAITIFSAGPLTVTSGTSAHSESGQFTANVGDTISVEIGESTEVQGTGSGSATAEAGGRLSVRLGSCVAEGAPAVSHVGLGILVALLGGLGMLMVVRRRALTTRVDR